MISDRANRLKGDRAFSQLLFLATNGPKDLREDYALVAAYVEREQLLIEIQEKASHAGAGAAEWQEIARFLSRSFTCGSLVFRNHN